jgi:EAL domain-containing protein (putative c-di-GMP-specific phosphodiesterase class I)
MVLTDNINVLVIAESQAQGTRLSRMVGRTLSGHYQPCSESDFQGYLVAQRYDIIILGNPSKLSSDVLELIHNHQPNTSLVMFDANSSVNAQLLDQQARRLNVNLVSVLPLPCPPERLEAVVERLTTAAHENSIDSAPMSAEEVSSALDAGKIQAWFQPKVRITDGVVTGFEALARWIEPDGSMLPPRVFIPSAEESEVIIPLTRKLISDSMIELSNWKRSNLNLKVSVNATVEVLDSDNFVSWLQGQLEHHQLAPSSITIEITESRVVGSASKVVENLTRLRQLGLGISLDDFGTGYSSLLQLSRMPCTELKIDRSFVSGASGKEETAVLLGNSVRIGRGLGLNVVAEGVETRADWEAVARAEVDEVQGWFVGRAQSADSVIPWIEDWNSRQLLLQTEQPRHDSQKNPVQKLLARDQWRFHPPNALTLTLLLILMTLSALLARIV